MAARRVRMDSQERRLEVSGAAHAEQASATFPASPAAFRPVNRDLRRTGQNGTPGKQVTRGSRPLCA